MILVEGENMQTQNKLLSYRIDFYFHDFKLAIETDENEHSDRNIDYEMIKSNRTRYLVLLELILTKNTSIFLEQSINSQLRKL